VNGKIYAIGGWDGERALGIVEEYDPITNTWIYKIPMKTRRHSFSTSVVNSKIYAIGGASYLGEIGLSIVEEYDPTTDTWTTKKDMLTGRSILSTSVVNGKIYAVGGGLGPNQWWSAFVEEYDPATDTWTQKKNMPTARWGLRTCTVNDKIYAIGGANTSGAGFQGGLHTVEVYDPVTDTWESRADMPTRRLYFSASVVDGKIYAIGGNPNYGICISTVEEYNPATDKWKEKTNMPTTRWGLSSSTINGKIYAIGGSTLPDWSDLPIATVEEYDPLSDPTSLKDFFVRHLTQFSLHQNYPNPFNPSTTIEFSLPTSALVTMKIHNIIGEEITTLVSEKLAAGKYEYKWDASNMPSGIYFYKIKAGNFTDLKKMVLLH
jgi:N-acetylneuraminic acid mutarotase